eukprot:6600983-Pyramimonas_sp.AAC.1
MIPYDLARQAPLWQDHRGRRIEDAYSESPPPPALLETPMWPTAGLKLGQGGGGGGGAGGGAGGGRPV